MNGHNSSVLYTYTVFLVYSAPELNVPQTPQTGEMNTYYITGARNTVGLTIANKRKWNWNHFLNGI